MNKTLTVNIGGLVFHIEERAYEVLRKYLDAIKSHFSPNDGRDEIMQDIESRIGEMLQQHLKDNKQVIVEEDVTSIINVMGKPEQFADGNEEKSKSNDEFYNEMYKRSYKKIYRDTEDRVLAGVCAGLSHRMGVDPLWLRLIWVFVTIVTWSGAFWLYLILAIVLPKAETPAQKLEMRGEPVNIDTIKKQWDTPASSPSRAKSSISSFFELLGDIVVTIFKAFVYFIGIILAIAGVAIFIALFILLLAAVGIAPLTPDGLFDMFISPSLQLWAAISLLLVIGIPAFLLIYILIKAIFKIKTSNKWLNVSMLVLWVAGFILFFYTLSMAAREYSYEQKNRNTITLVQPANGTLYVDVIKDIDFDRYHHNDVSFFGRRFNYTKGKSEFMIPEVTLKIEKAEGTEFVLEQINIAHGGSDKEAYENALKLNFKIEQIDSVLKLNEFFPLEKGEKFRNQKVKLILKVPVGKSVYLSSGTKHILNDVDNVTNTWDWEMVNRTWTMTAKGLECIGCNLEDHNDNPDAHSEVSITSDDGSANIKIDKNGVVIETDKDTLKADDVKIKIDNKGIDIKTDKSK